jgi:hypothetical protein
VQLNMDLVLLVKTMNVLLISKILKLLVMMYYHFTEQMESKFIKSVLLTVML